MTSCPSAPVCNKENSVADTSEILANKKMERAEISESIIIPPCLDRIDFIPASQESRFIVPNRNILQNPTESLKVSIIIANGKGRGEYLKRCLGSIMDTQTEHRMEVLVGSDGNKSSCRNELVSRANGDILLFFDDDVELRLNTINELVSPFLSQEFSNTGIVGGCNIAFHNAEYKEKLGNKLLSNSLATFKSSARYCPKGDIRLSDEAEILSCNMAVLKKAFVEAGGFPQDIIPCEENVLINKIQALGYSVIYNPYAVVYHRQPKLFKQYANQVFAYGKGRGIMMRKHEGKPKMLPKLSRESFLLAAGLVVHYVSYLSGVVYGYVTAGSSKGNKDKKNPKNPKA